jgi:hypothetical protein
LALLTRSEELSIPGFVTIAQGAKLKGVSYDALRIWLRNHPEIATKHIGKSIILRTVELEKYPPWSGR